MRCVFGIVQLAFEYAREFHHVSLLQLRGNANVFIGPRIQRPRGEPRIGIRIRQPEEVATLNEPIA